MKDLKEKLRSIDRDIEVKQRELDLLGAQRALVLLGERPAPTAPERQRAPRSNVKQCVIDLLRDVGPNGLNANIAVAMAESEKGLRLGRGTVSSLLSRMKSEGVVTYIDGFYRLPEHSPSQDGDRPSVVSVHPFRASGGGS